MIKMKPGILFHSKDINTVLYLFQTLKKLKITRAHLPRTIVYQMLERTGRHGLYNRSE